MHNVLGKTKYLQGALLYLFLRISRLANPYMRRGSLIDRRQKNGAFLLLEENPPNK